MMNDEEKQSVNGSKPNGIEVNSELENGEQYHDAVESHPLYVAGGIQAEAPSSSAGVVDPSPSTISSARQKMTGRLLLFGVSFLYGTLNVVFRWVYELPGPPSASALSTVRGWMAAACFLPFLANRERNQQQEEDRPPTTSRHRRPPFWIIALELGALNFFSQGLVNIGLLWTESARASFLTQTSVVMTPVLSAIAGHSVRKTVWIACACAMGGLVLMSSSGGKIGKGFGFGDVLCLLGAFCWSTYIFRLSAVGDLFDEINMQSAKTFNLAVLYSIWFLIASSMSDVSLWPGWTNVEAWVLLFYSALGPGTVADIMQQKGQAKIAASESNIILSVEPVFTSLLGYVILGEQNTPTEMLGGSLIIIAAIIATR